MQTQTQFYHHKDLWVLNLTTNAWEQVDAKSAYAHTHRTLTQAVYIDT